MKKLGDLFNSILAGDKNGSTQAKALEEELNQLDHVLAELEDPEYGTIGRDVIDALARCDVKEHIDTDHPAIASQRTDYIPKHTNEIIYGARALKDRFSLFQARIHEQIHVLQDRSCPATFANPVNPRTNVVLSPASFIRLVETIESDAFAKGTWLSALASDAGLSGENDLYPVGKTDFQTFRAESESVEGVLAKTAEHAMEQKNQKDIVRREYYQHKAIMLYNHYLPQLIARKNAGEIVFVHVEPEDLLAAGNSIGPNFLDLENLQAPSTLSEKDQIRLAAVNDALGLPHDDRQLPSFRDALKKQMLSPEDYHGLQLSAPSQLELMRLGHRTLQV